MQRRFAPAQGKRRALPVKRFDATLAPLAQRIADRARMLAALESRGDDSSALQAHLDDDVLRLYLGQDLPDAELAQDSVARSLRAPG